jgi:hypothetical protein
LVFYGENQAEYGNSKEENASPYMDYKYFSKDSGSEIRFGSKSIAEIVESTDFTQSDFVPYIPPSEDSLRESKVEVRYLGYYLRWDPQECYYYAAENTGFEANTSRTEGSYSKYSSLDDKIDPFHYYTTLIKFGLGRASYDASQEIRNNKITREEGVSLVKKFDGEFPAKYFNEFLDYVNLDESRFTEIIEEFRTPHLWEKQSDGWHLRAPVWNQ